MRHLLQLNRNKKGVSLIISYVLLITIAVALSILVYNWLRFYVQDSEAIGCKEGTTLVIQDYECSLADGGTLDLTLKNKGRFNVDGFILKVHDRVGAELGLYTLVKDGSSEGRKMTPGEVYNQEYSFSEAEDFDGVLQKISLIEVQPFVLENNEKVFCAKVSSQSVECS